MIVVLGCILDQHDLKLVGIALLLCLLSCATAMAMMARARAAMEGKMRLVWIIAAGLVAGAGIWATHFVALMAYSAGLPIAFDPGLTILSVAVAVISCILAGRAALSRLGGVVGGMMAGMAVCALHYLSMAAVRISADPVWNLQLVAASILVAVSLGGLAGHFGMRHRNMAGALLATGFAALAIGGAHFTGMAAVTFRPNGAPSPVGAVLNPAALAAIVTASAAFMIAQGLVVALVDGFLDGRARNEAARMRNHIAELEATKIALEKSSADLTLALTVAAEASHAKSAFLASMSHELRTPLNAVIGFSDTMVMEIFGPLQPRYRDYARDINTSGAHLLSLINDILDLSRLEANQTELREEEFDMAALASDAQRMVSGQAAQACITLETCVEPDLPQLRADRRRIKQIILNLVSNALKFTPSGGRVIVRVMRVADGLALSVKDTGIGIAPQDIPRALERFGQVDSSLARKYEGSGLGLPLSKRFAELHGGSLTLESTIDTGTIVTIHLPASRLVGRGAAAAA